MEWGFDYALNALLVALIHERAEHRHWWRLGLIHRIHRKPHWAYLLTLHRDKCTTPDVDNVNLPDTQWNDPARSWAEWVVLFANKEAKRNGTYIRNHQVRCPCRYCVQFRALCRTR